MPSAYRVQVTDRFSAAHHLRGVEGPCARVHGHNWKVRVTVCAGGLDEAHMAVDFLPLRDGLRELLDRWEHRDLNRIPPFDEARNPTAESVALTIAERLSGALAGTLGAAGARIEEVVIWETDDLRVSYRPPVEGAP